MPRNDRSDEIRDGFLAALRERDSSVKSVADLAAIETNDTLRTLFLGLGRAGREIYLVGGVGFVHVHIRGESPGWWNILKSVKSDLDFLAREIGVKRYYVLLIGRKDSHVANGYIATDLESSPFVKAPIPEATKYSINENVHLDQNKRLLSVNKIVKTIFETQEATSNAP